MIAFIMAFTMSPSFGGDSGPDESDAGGCDGSDSQYSSEAYEDFKDSDMELQAGGYTETVSGDSYIDRMLGGTSNRTDPRLPGYSYFQGIIQANRHITIAGQVRVVGAVLGGDGTPGSPGTCSLYSGAMVTTNAHALMGASDNLNDFPAGVRTRIRSWEEITPR